ncbi:MAG: universal stress protein [Cyclobacteriaceae bacterium]
MRQPEKLLVNLDLSELDSSLMQYAAFLCDHMPVKELVLVHNMLISEPPEELKALYPEMEEPLEQLVEREIEESINRFFHKKNLEVTVNIFQNENIGDIIKWVKKNDIDLSLVGKKAASDGQGFYSRQYLRLTSHPVLLIPPQVAPRISRILAPVDFSRNAIHVIRTAHQLAISMQGEVSYLHFYELPPRYFPYVAQNVAKYQQEYVAYARKEFEEWKEKSIKNEKTGEVHFHLAERNQVAREVYFWAIRHQADLIVCGAKGKSDAEVLLLGSVSDKLISTDQHIPLLIVKRKESYSWLDSLLD